MVPAVTDARTIIVLTGEMSLKAMILCYPHLCRIQAHYPDALSYIRAFGNTTDIVLASMQKDDIEIEEP